MGNIAIMNPAGIESIPAAREKVIVMEMVTRTITFLNDPEAVDDADHMGPSAYRVGDAVIPAEAFLPGEGRCRTLSSRWKAQVHPPFLARWFRRMTGTSPLAAVVLKGTDFGGTSHKVSIPRSAIQRIETVEGSLFVSE